MNVPCLPRELRSSTKLSTRKAPAPQSTLSCILRWPPSSHFCLHRGWRSRLQLGGWCARQGALAARAERGGQARLLVEGGRYSVDDWMGVQACRVRGMGRWSCGRRTALVVPAPVLARFPRSPTFYPVYSEEKPQILDDVPSSLEITKAMVQSTMSTAVGWIPASTAQSPASGKAEYGVVDQYPGMQSALFNFLLVAAAAVHPEYMGESHSDAGIDLGFDSHAGCTFYSNLPNPIQIYQTDNSLAEKHSLVFLNLIHRASNRGLQWEFHGTTRRSAYGPVCESGSWWLMYMNP
ncbi:hypothetical protein B0H13DRAFT_1878949 [Mycena leptocephala]|nr:hypothetical protein B0H13DRAFT_1878949 [Mycena leptocephala]